jgi:hypothetical protein
MMKDARPKNRQSSESRSPDITHPDGESIWFGMINNNDDQEVRRYKQLPRNDSGLHDRNYCNAPIIWWLEFHGKNA